MAPPLRDVCASLFLLDNIKIDVRTSLLVERFGFTSTANDKREFVPRDQVVPISCRALFITSTQKAVV